MYMCQFNFLKRKISAQISQWLSPIIRNNDTRGLLVDNHRHDYFLFFFALIPRGCRGNGHCPREKKLPRVHLIHFADFVLFRGSFFIRRANPFAVSFSFLVTELPQTRAILNCKKSSAHFTHENVPLFDDHIFGISN